MKTIQVAGGIVIKNGLILVAQRKKSSSQGGLYEFPGGKLEANESPVECLRRELDEELGLSDIKILGHYMTVQHLYSTARIELHLFICQTHGSTTRQTSHELIDWVLPQNLHQFEWAPADMPAVLKLGQEGLPQFFPDAG